MNLVQNLHASITDDQKLFDELAHKTKQKRVENL